MRLFFAAPLKHQAIESIGKTQSQLRSVLPSKVWRWTRPVQWHLTLKFLGHCEDSILSDLTKWLHKVCQDQGPLSLELGRLGTFGSRRSPRVLWIGIEDAASQLQGLAQQFERDLEAWGFQKEERPYRPHITLARIKGRPPKDELSALEKALETNANLSPLAFDLEKVALIRSTLKPEGSKYEVLAEADLGPETL